MDSGAGRVAMILAMCCLERAQGRGEWEVPAGHPDWPLRVQEPLLPLLVVPPLTAPGDHGGFCQGPEVDEPEDFGTEAERDPVRNMGS